MAEDIQVMFINSLNTEKTLLEQERILSDRDKALFDKLRKSIQSHKKKLDEYTNRLKNLRDKKPELEILLNRIKKVHNDELEERGIFEQLENTEKKKVEVDKALAGILNTEIRLVSYDFKTYKDEGNWIKLKEVIIKMRNYTNDKIRLWNELADLYSRLKFYRNIFREYLLKIRKDLNTLARDLKIEKTELQELKAFT